MMCVCDWGLPEYQRDLKNNAEKLFKMMKKLDEKLLNHRMVYQLK